MNDKTMRNKISIERIKEILVNHKKDIKEKYSVKEIGIFGSYVRGEEKQKSDLDVLVEF
ncbi:MAG: nucleotidyltransferase domain-containing protein, partial [bacterium]